MNFTLFSASTYVCFFPIVFSFAMLKFKMNENNLSMEHEATENNIFIFHYFNWLCLICARLGVLLVHGAWQQTTFDCWYSVRMYKGHVINRIGIAIYPNIIQDMNQESRHSFHVYCISTNFHYFEYIWFRLKPTNNFFFSLTFSLSEILLKLLYWRHRWQKSKEFFHFTLLNAARRLTF